MTVWWSLQFNTRLEQRQVWAVIRDDEDYVGRSEEVSDWRDYVTSTSECRLSLGLMLSTVIFLFMTVAVARSGWKQLFPSWYLSDCPPADHWETDSKSADTSRHLTPVITSVEAPGNWKYQLAITYSLNYLDVRGGTSTILNYFYNKLWGKPQMSNQISPVRRNQCLLMIFL